MRGWFVICLLLGLLGGVLAHVPSFPRPPRTRDALLSHGHLGGSESAWRKARSHPGTFSPDSFDADSFDADSFHSRSFDSRSFDSRSFDSRSFGSRSLDAGSLDAGSLDAGTFGETDGRRFADLGPWRRTANGWEDIRRWDPPRSRALPAAAWVDPVLIGGLQFLLSLSSLLYFCHYRVGSRS